MRVHGDSRQAVERHRERTGRSREDHLTYRANWVWLRVAARARAMAARLGSCGHGAQEHAPFILLIASILLTGAARAQGVTVSQNGTPSYAYSVPMPPGVAGLAPHFALTYDAGGANGPVGYGWGLSG